MNSSQERKLAGIEPVLVPYTEFDAHDLADQLTSLVKANKDILVARNLGGLISRYSDPEIAVEKVKKGQLEHPVIGHFAVVGASGDVGGSASVVKGLTLTKHRMTLLPSQLRQRFIKQYPFAQQNVHAWTTEGHPDLLVAAYKDLLFTANAHWIRPQMRNAWTVEPLTSPRFIHEAINTAGLKTVDTDYYDDGETSSKLPPKATLYARTYSEWASGRGIEKELATGIKSWDTLYIEHVIDITLNQLAKEVIGANMKLDDKVMIKQMLKQPEMPIEFWNGPNDLRGPDISPN